MSNQSTNHIMMMEPVNFYANPETMETNTYQHENPADISAVQLQAREEFRGLRDQLVVHGVIVTTALGTAESPDDVFCNNWISTHEGGELIYYPMFADNRRIERRPDIMHMLEGRYEVTLDLSREELDGRFLESTGSLAMDRVNKVAYCALSSRSEPTLAEQWADHMGYTLVTFNTHNHAGKPVYHTDVLMFMGSGYIGICAQAIDEGDRDFVLNQMRATHEVIELSMDQMKAFCGNALEVRGTGGKRYLAMSSAARNALRDDQISALSPYIEGVIHSDIATIEKYGGGSARCMLLELY